MREAGKRAVSQIQSSNPDFLPNEFDEGDLLGTVRKNSDKHSSTYSRGIGGDTIGGHLPFDDLHATSHNNCNNIDNNNNNKSERHVPQPFLENEDIHFIFLKNLQQVFSFILHTFDEHFDI